MWDEEVAVQKETLSRELVCASASIMAWAAVLRHGARARAVFSTGPAQIKRAHLSAS